MKEKYKQLISLILALIVMINVPIIISAQKDGTLVIKASSVNAKPEETVQVEITLERNPGISSLKFDIAYDDDLLILNSVDMSTDFGSYVTTPQPYTNPQTINMISPLEDVTTKGILATLTFTVSADADDNSVAEISLLVDPDDVFDLNYDNVDCEVVNGKVSVFHGIPGDIDGNQKVNNKDAILLFRYIAGWTVEVDAGALDVTGDGKVNNKDAITLFRYIAGWPDIVLYRGNSHKHNLVGTEQVPATCVNEGNIAYWYCSGCKKYYSDPNAAKEISYENICIPATGHTFVVDPAVPATYDSTGLTEGSHCGVCGVVIVPQETTPILIRVPSYNVTFYDSDGTSVLTNRTEVPEGGYAQPPVNPSKNGASFLGWSGKYANVTEDGSVKAVYSDEKNVFMVSSASGSRNNTVSVLVSLDGAVKTCGFDLNILYDEGLELISVDDDLDLDVIANTEAIDNGIILNFSSTSDKTKQRDIIELTFRIKDSAASSLPVNITINSVKELVDGRIANADYSTVCGVIQVNG